MEIEGLEVDKILVNTIDICPKTMHNGLKKRWKTQCLTILLCLTLMKCHIGYRE